MDNERIKKLCYDIFSFPQGEIFYLKGKNECEGSIPVYWKSGTAYSTNGYRIVQVKENNGWHNLIERDSMYEVAQSMIFFYDCYVDIGKTHNYNVDVILSVLD